MPKVPRVPVGRRWHEDVEFGKEGLLGSVPGVLFPLPLPLVIRFVVVGVLGGLGWRVVFGVTGVPDVILLVVKVLGFVLIVVLHVMVVSLGN